MSSSNNRVHEYDSVHHITSRIAHRVFFLGESERNDIIEFIRRSSEFAGLRLLGWCILSNHFHLLVYLPHPEIVDEEEVLRRYGILKGEKARRGAEIQLAQWRKGGDDLRAGEWLDGIRKRMYDVGKFMKIVKQWFTEEYNRRQSHCGTLWESVYHDHVIPREIGAMSKVLAYIHLNPIRAALTDKYDDYAWSSFCALKKKDVMAEDGIRFVYDQPNGDVAALASRHVLLLDELLEQEQRRRAEELARKRANGYEVPKDPLTSEAMIAQAAAHLRKVQDALDELNASRRRKPHRRVEVADQEVLCAITANPSASVEMLATMLSLATSSVYERIRSLKAKGMISRRSRNDPWQIHTIK